MPSKQRTFCWCFGGRPPEITYGIENGAPLKAMAVDVPMPTDEDELNAKFDEIVVSTNSFRTFIIMLPLIIRCGNFIIKLCTYFVN